MILLSVGTQFPFDRLVGVVDQWAATHRNCEITAQIGITDLKVENFLTHPFFTQTEFGLLQQACTLMVTHAGIGSIIGSLEAGKPVIIMARDPVRGEHRNAHQFDTLRQFGSFPGVYPARSSNELRYLLDNRDSLVAGPKIGKHAPEDFIDQLRQYLDFVLGEGKLSSLAPNTTGRDPEKLAPDGRFST